MNPTYLVNLAFYIGTIILFSLVLASAARKYKERKNRVTKWLFFVLFFYALSLTFVLINTILEYVLVVYPTPWDWGFRDPSAWYFYFQYILQFGCARDSAILIANLFLAYFYFEIFIRERTRIQRVVFGLYGTATVGSVGFLLIVVYVIDYLQKGLSMEFPNVIVQMTVTTTKLILVLVHTAVIFVPLGLKSIILRHHLARQHNEENMEMIRKFTYIFLMIIYFFGLFIFALLDMTSATEFSFWFYCTFVSESLAAIMVYLGFIKDLKKK